MPCAEWPDQVQVHRLPRKTFCSVLISAIYFENLSSSILKGVADLLLAGSDDTAELLSGLEDDQSGHGSNFETVHGVLALIHIDTL